MVGTRHKPESSGVSNDEIRRLIHDEVAASIQEAISEMFGSIKTTLIEKFDDRYAAITEAAVAVATTAVTAARPHEGDSLLYREFSNTKPS